MLGVKVLGGIIIFNQHQEMSRQRRKRMSESNLQEETTHQHTRRQQAKRGKGEVVFMEEMDYKMEVEDKAEEKKLVVLKKEEFTE
jgi:hypothetical protein